VLVTPTVTFPKATLEGTTAICGCTPVPLREIVKGEFVALLVTVTVPANVPVALGANFTLSDVDCPGERVSGTVGLVRVKPAPLSVICEIVTLEFPVLETDTFSVALEPVFTLPKPKDVEEAESCKVEATPVPLRAMEVGAFGALLTRVRLPEKVPAEAGANPTLKEEAPPGAMERGRASPDKVYPLPVNEAWVTFSVEEPGFCNVIFCVLVTPTITLPKLELEGVTEISG